MSENQVIHKKYLSLYKWFYSQDDNNVFIKFKLPSDFDSNQIQIEFLDKQTIKVFVNDGIPFLYGTLFDEVSENYTKSVASEHFILTLTKSKNIEWTRLIKAVAKDKLKADPKSCYSLGMDQIVEFPNEMLTPLLALSVEYHYPEACLYFGNKCLTEGNLKDALENYQLIADSYEFPTAELQTGITLFKIGKLKEAKEYLERASKGGIIIAQNVLDDVIKAEKEADAIKTAAVQAASTLTAAEAAAETINIAQNKVAENIAVATAAETEIVAENIVAREIAAENIASTEIAIAENNLAKATDGVVASAEAAIVAENIVTNEVAALTRNADEVENMNVRTDKKSKNINNTTIFVGAAVILISAVLFFTFKKRRN